jgi:diguanylate cyclase (GGDEF)-like protein
MWIGMAAGIVHGALYAAADHTPVPAGSPTEDGSMTRVDLSSDGGSSSLDALAQRWLRHVTPQGFVPRKARARAVLRGLLQQLTALASADPFDPTPAARLGAALVEARMASPRVLGASLPLLTEWLPTLPGMDAPVIRARFLPLLGHLAQGFTAAARDHAVLAAEDINRAERVAWRDEQQRLQSRLQRARLYDVVSNLPNRVSLREHLRTLIANAEPDTRLGVCLLRINDFGNLNDALGHPAGDDLLHTIGLQLREVVAELARGASPAGDYPDAARRYLLAHLGGEQFVITVTPTTGADDATKIAKLAQRTISNASLPWIDGYQLRVTTTAGLVEDHISATTADDWLRNAHIALSWTRTDHRPYAVFDPIRAQAGLRRHRLTAAMPAALERGEFTPHFQPLHALADRTMIGVEALVRWQRRGTTTPLAPQDFIGLAEQTGLIRPLGQAVLRQACHHGARWHTAGHDLLISVNLSPLQLADPDLTASIDDILHHSGLPASNLQLEITESTAVAGPTYVLEELADRGVQLAIDDFGTGHANLAALSRLPVTTVKLAAELVAGLHDTDNAAAAAVAHRTIQLCHDLNVTVTAEGIETETQYARLRALGCDHGQGFLFGRAAPARTISQLLRTTGQHPQP